MNKGKIITDAICFVVFATASIYHAVDGNWPAFWGWILATGLQGQLLFRDIQLEQ